MSAAPQLADLRAPSGTIGLLSEPFSGVGTLRYGFDVRRVRRAGPSIPPPARPLDPGAPLPGTRLVVVRLLGQGGMGEVYEVEHADLGRRSAVKLLHRSHCDRQDLGARMRDEACSLGRLRHPNLVEVLDLGVTADGRPYFLMELLRGRDLRAEVARLGVVAVPTALSLALQALAGLGAAHAAGIIHRDVKLENLFLCDDGSLKVLDFGVAKVDRGDGSRTAAGVAVGTPRTMAPEQHAAGPVDARADLYAIGLAIYELIAGRGPFDELRGQPHALRFAHCDREPPPPSRFAPQPIPPEVERLILRALEKSPERRFRSASDMADAILLLLSSEGARAPLGLSSAAVDSTEVDSTEIDRPRRPAPVGAARRRRGPRPAARVIRLGSASGGVVGLCALVVASAALGVALAQHLSPVIPRQAPVQVEARPAPGVR